MRLAAPVARTGVPASEGDAVDEWVQREVVANLAALARHQVDHACRHARLDKALHHVHAGCGACRSRRGVLQLRQSRTTPQPAS